MFAPLRLVPTECTSSGRRRPSISWVSISSATTPLKRDRRWSSRRRAQKPPLPSKNSSPTPTIPSKWSPSPTEALARPASMSPRRQNRPVSYLLTSFILPHPLNQANNNLKSNTQWGILSLSYKWFQRSVENQRRLSIVVSGSCRD